MTGGADGVGWIASLDALRDVAARLVAELPAADAGRETDLAVKMYGTVMATCLQHLWADPEHPSFLPSVGYHQMYGSPNPDTLYRTAAIDGHGSYRMTGLRGTVPDVTIMPFGPPTAGGLQTFAPFDLDELDLGPDGSFEVQLSQQRPAGAGNWWLLDPAMRSLMLRSVSDDWGHHVEPRIALTRLDGDPRRERFDPDAVSRRLVSYAMVVQAMMMSGLNRVRQLRADGVVNRLVDVDYSGSGGLATQSYQEGCFSLDTGELLVIEATLPAGCTGFSISLTDPFFSTIDWANAQSSLNQRQASPDDDGVLRVVVAATDPGVANWLDTTGHGFGVVQCRWFGGPEAPVTRCRTAQESMLGDVLPAGGHPVSPQQRADEIRARQVGVQLRS